MALDTRQWIHISEAATEGTVYEIAPPPQTPTWQQPPEWNATIPGVTLQDDIRQLTEAVRELIRELRKK